MPEKPIVLSTKILSESLKQELLNHNLELVEHNFIEVKNTSFSIENLIGENLIFTSQNAVLSLLEQQNTENLKTKPVFCVGMKTKALLEENGFEVAVYTDYAEDLAEIISLVYNEEKFSFFSGNLRKELLPNSLKKAKIVCQEIEVYQTKLTPKTIISQLDAILFFSPSAVESYMIDNKITKEICFCIGNTTAESLEKYTQNIIIADFPSIESVVEDCITEFV